MGPDQSAVFQTIRYLNHSETSTHVDPWKAVSGAVAPPAGDVRVVHALQLLQGCQADYSVSAVG